MTKTELNVNLMPFWEDKDNLIAEIYFILKSQNGDYIKLLDIDEDAQVDLTLQFINEIYDKIINYEDLDVIDISSDDDRTKVIYEYDLDEIPTELSKINEIIVNEDLPEFSFDVDKLDDIRGILIFIENKGQTLVLYKQHYPINLYKKDNSFFGKNFGNHKRFAKVESDYIKINSSFDFFKLNDTLFIRNLSVLEKFFGFHKVIKKKASSCIKSIEAANLVENPDELNSMIDDISFARKLTKVSKTSPVLGLISSNDLVSFSNTHPALKGKFKYNDETSKIVLNSKKSKKLFVKLLNDDYLLSELTKHHYDSLSKDRIKTFKTSK